MEEKCQQLSEMKESFEQRLQRLGRQAESEKASLQKQHTDVLASTSEGLQRYLIFSEVVCATNHRATVSWRTSLRLLAQTDSATASRLLSS